MKIAVIADSHWSERLRFDECKRVHQWIAEDVARRGVDLIIHTGDLYDRPTVPDERDAAAQWVQAMAEVAPFYIVRGNHDPVNELPLLERLRAKHPIHVCEAAEVTVAETRSGPVALGLLGWPQRSNIAQLAHLTRRDETEQVAQDALRGVFRYFGTAFAALDPSIPRIVAAHAMVRGSRVSTGQPLVGCDFEIGLEDLALARAHMYLLGHVHKAQDWTLGAQPGTVNHPMGPPVVYPGDPRRTNFGELEAKGYVIAEWQYLDEPSEEPGYYRAVPRFVWQHIETPCTPMVLLEDEWGFDATVGQDAWTGMLQGYAGPESVAGAEVKFRYRVPANKREAAMLAAEGTRTMLLEDGAVDVVLEPEVIVEQRARAPEVAQAVTLEQKVEALWSVKGFDPGTRREPILNKLALLQG